MFCLPGLGSSDQVSIEGKPVALLHYCAGQALTVQEKLNGP